MGAIDTIKALGALALKLGNMELNQKVLTLQGELLELNEELRVRTTKIEDLQRVLALKEQLRFQSPFYFLTDDTQPYCPRCWEADQSAIHLSTPVNTDAGPCYTCPNCKQDYFHPRRERLPGPHFNLTRFR